MAGVIVEVQRRPDRAKLLTWPVYVAALRAKLDCTAVLMVVAPDPEVAAWARRPIELGHPGFALTPIVIGFDDVPWVDRAAASRVPELAVLSALAHPELEIAEIALDAIAQLPEERGKLYYDVILMALPAALRQLLEDRMQKYEYRSEFARKYYGEGLEKGLEKGLEDGLRAAAVALAQAKLGALSAEDLAVLDAVSDQRVLTQLITALGQAGTAAEARATLDRACPR